MYDARTKLADQVVQEVRDHFGDKVVRDGRAPLRCDCRRPRRSASRSSSSTRDRVVRSPIETSHRRCTMVRRSGLGKGLSSLIPPGEATASGGDDAPILIDIPVAGIMPNPHQPRVHFDEESLAELDRLDPRARCAAAGPGPPGRATAATS